MAGVDFHVVAEEAVAIGEGNEAGGAVGLVAGEVGGPHVGHQLRCIPEVLVGLSRCFTHVAGEVGEAHVVVKIFLVKEGSVAEEAGGMGGHMLCQAISIVCLQLKRELTVLLFNGAADESQRGRGRESEREIGGIRGLGRYIGK